MSIPSSENPNEYPWLRQAWQSLVSYMAVGRIPHALLLHGPHGLGKSVLARTYARRLLCTMPTDLACGTCTSCLLFEASTHPDFKWIAPEEAGKSIKIDAIRRLINDLSLKSQYDGYRVVVIDSAHSMNTSAANALLKTLEEPADRTVIILLSDRAADLPATILSRCQKLSILLPALAVTRAWLMLLRPGCAADALLATAGGSPLAALAICDEDDAAVGRRLAFLSDFCSLLEGREDPVTLAEKWTALNVDELLDWLTSWLIDLMRLVSAPGYKLLRNPDLAEDMRRTAARLDSGSVSNYWAQVLQSRRAVAGQANRHLLLEGLLIQASELGRSQQLQMNV
jgi:DNA polymerase-3 subunit delta'